MTVKAEFVISAKDKTREAIEGAQKRLESLDRTARMLRYAFAGYIFAEFARHVVETDIKLQSMRYTLEAATGSMAGAREEMNFMFQTADKLGLSIRDVGQYYARMAAIAVSSGYSLKQFHQEFVNISGGMRVLHLDARHTQYAWLALQEIMAQGTVKMRHLTRQLSIDFPTALQAMALGMHKTVGQLFQMVHDKALQGQDAMRGLSKGLKEMYGPEVQSASHGLQADLSRLSNKFTEAINAADTSGKFKPFEKALGELSATISNPAFITAFGEFIAGLAHIAKFSATEFEHWVNGVSILANKIESLTGNKQFGDVVGNTLKERLASATEQAKAIYAYSQGHHLGQGTKYQGKWYSVPHDTFQKWLRLSRLIRHLQAIQAQGPAAVAQYNAELQKSVHHHAAMKHVTPFTTVQTGVIKSLGELNTSVTDKLSKQVSLLDRAQKLVSSIGPGTKGFNKDAYAAALKQLEFLKQHKAELDKINAAKEKQKEIQKQINQYDLQHQKYTQALAKDAERWKQILDPMRKVREEAKKLTEEYQRGMLTWSQFMGAMRKNANDAHKVFGSMNQYAISAARNMQSAFAQFLEDPFKGGLRGMLESFAKTLEKMVAQWLAAQAIMKAANAMKGQSGWVGAVGSILGSLGGGKAFGGPVSAGTMYPVGENGPEMFVPGQNGTIIPNSALGNGHHVTVNIDARGAGPDEVSKLMAMRHGIIKQLRGEMLYKQQFGHLPA